MGFSYSPLRFPGGKHKYWRYIDTIIKKDGNINTLVEPFAGGCGLGLALLKNKIINKLYINDKDVFIHALWDQILNDPNELIYKIKHIVPSVDNFIKYKRRLSDVQNGIEFPNVEIAFSFFYINRTSRSGIVKGGPIGGKYQSGEWKINARWNEMALVKKINSLNQLRDNIQLFNLDYKLFINKMIDDYKTDFGSLMFFIDPPYYKIGKKLYLQFFIENDHIELAELLKKINYSHKWVLTYDESEFIKDLYKFSKRNEGGISYTIGGRNTKKELIYFSDKLRSKPGKHGFIEIKEKRRHRQNHEPRAQYVI